MNHWSKIKIPPVGMSDGMVRHRLKPYSAFRDMILSELEPQIPRYVRCIKWCVYADFWLGIKKVDDTIYCTDDKTEKWQFVLKDKPECFESATKLQWNLSRNHGTPPIETPFDWDRYSESVNRRAEILRTGINQ